MEKEKTVQLLEQLNCKMDKIIKLLEDNHPSNVNVLIKSISEELRKTLNKESEYDFIQAVKNVKSRYRV